MMIWLLLLGLGVRISASGPESALQTTLKQGFRMLLREQPRGVGIDTWQGRTSLHRVLPVWQATQARRTEGAFAGSNGMLDGRRQCRER